MILGQKMTHFPQVQFQKNQIHRFGEKLKNVHFVPENAPVPLF